MHSLPYFGKNHVLHMSSYNYHSKILPTNPEPQWWRRGRWRQILHRVPPPSFPPSLSIVLVSYLLFAICYINRNMNMNVNNALLNLNLRGSLLWRRRMDGHSDLYLCSRRSSSSYSSEHEISYHIISYHIMCEM